MQYRSKADSFFREQEKNRIKETTETIEKGTIGEIAVMVVDSSDRYHDAEVTGGIFLGSLLSLIITISLFHSSVWSYIPLSFIFFFPSKLLLHKYPVLKKAFLGLKRKESAVMQRAVTAFYQKELYKTKKNTGVLFFISLFERKMWVLADKGIYEKIDQQTLNKFADMVSAGIKEGRACDALCSAIREAGELLAKYFPITPDDTDELPDEVMTE
jgi:putative membrane protein